MTLFAWRTQHILKNWLYSDVMYMHWNALIFKWDRSMHFDKCLHSCNHPIVKVKSISIIPPPQISSGSLAINPVHIWDAIVNGFSFLIFLKILFIFRGEERKRGRETSLCGCFSHAPYWGSGLQPRHVPWSGIESVTLWFTVPHAQSTELHQPGLFFNFYFPLTHC